MTDENRVAELLKAIARIDDHTVFGGLDWRAFRNGDVDAIVAAAFDVVAEIVDDGATNRPAIFADARGFRSERGHIGLLLDIADACRCGRSGRYGRSCGRSLVGFRLGGCGFHCLGRFLCRYGGCLDGVGRSTRHGECLADTDAFGGNAVRGLEGCNRNAVFTSDLCQAVARLNLVTTGWRHRLATGRCELAVFGRNLVAGNTLRGQHGYLLVWTTQRVRLVAVAVERNVTSRSLGGIADLTEFRNKDRLASLRGRRGLQTVDPQQFLFGNAVAVGDSRDAFTRTQRYRRGAIRMPAVLVGTDGCGGEIVGNGSGSLLCRRCERRSGWSLCGRERLGHGFVAGRRVAACHRRRSRQLGALHRRGRSRTGRRRLNATAITAGRRIGVGRHVLIGVAALGCRRGITTVHVALRDRGLPISTAALAGWN